MDTHIPAEGKAARSPAQEDQEDDTCKRVSDGGPVLVVAEGHKALQANPHTQHATSVRECVSGADDGVLEAHRVLARDMHVTQADNVKALTQAAALPCALS